LLGFGAKEVWELAPKIVFAFPSGFFFRMVSPLDFVEFDRTPSGNTNIFFENLERSLPIGQVLVQVDGEVVDVFENIRLVRNFETLPEQGNVEDIMIIS
jgi:hypothetical protein